VATAAASAFPEFKRGIAWYIFAGFTLVSTVIWGRLYCGRICAFGAFTQILDVIVPKSLRREPPAWLEKRAGYIKFGLLAAVLVYFIATHDMFVYRYVEPFWMFTGLGNVVMWTMLGVMLLATLMVRNLYCRFLCPVGAALGVIAKATTVLPIKRWSECTSCRICEKACEWGAIQGPKIIQTECVRCDDCERIYADKKACVHWLMIVKKEKWAAAGIRGNQPASAGSSAAR
jgi:NosR/NirI family transcriptional regulator, nitrous oxide reductase regulator